MRFIIFRLTSVLILIASLTACSSLLYAPSRNLYADPKKMGLSFEEVGMTSQSKRIYGWYFKQTVEKTPKGFILMFHGNGQNRSAHFWSLVWMLDQGYDYFIFDYQGYGESDGKPSPEATVADGVTALKWFFETAKDKRYAKSSLMVYAQSLGGAVALRSLEEYQKNEVGGVPARLDWVILESTFLSYQRAAMSVLSKHWFTYPFQLVGGVVISDHWAPSNELSYLPKTHYLVIHGDQDPLIDDGLGKDLYEKLPSPKVWMPIEGGQHINSMFIRDGFFRTPFLNTIQSTHE
jgi:fermentation-respiration switch protein FrsA (DUF1100 family)